MLLKNKMKLIVCVSVLMAMTSLSYAQEKKIRK